MKKEARKRDIITETSVIATIKGSLIETRDKMQVKMNTSMTSNNNREDVAVVVVDIVREAVTMMVGMEITNTTMTARAEEEEEAVDMVVKVEAEGNALINKIAAVSSRGRHPETLLST